MCQFLKQGCLFDYENNQERREQAGAELCQAQFKPGLAKHALPN